MQTLSTCLTWRYAVKPRDRSARKIVLEHKRISRNFASISPTFPLHSLSYMSSRKWVGEIFIEYEIKSKLPFLWKKMFFLPFILLSAVLIWKSFFHYLEWRGRKDLHEIKLQRNKSKHFPLSCKLIQLTPK